MGQHRLTRNFASVAREVDAGSRRDRTGRSTVVFALAAVAGLAIVVLAAKPLLVVFGGVLFALVLSGLARGLTRWLRLPYRAAVFVVVTAIVGSAIVGAVSVGPRLREQVDELSVTLPAAAGDMIARIKREPIGRAVTAPATGEQTNRAVASGAVFALGTTVEILGALVVIFFVGIYGAVRPEDYKQAAIALASASHQERVRTTLEEAATTLTRWLLGRLAAMLFVGVTCAIAFSLLDIPLALTLAVIAGLLTFVEYVGAILSAVPPVLLALTKGPTTALAVLGVFTALHVVEGYVLTPLLARASSRIPPALTLTGQVVLAALVGPLGLTFSTPLLVVAMAASRGWRQASKNEHGPG